MKRLMVVVVVLCLALVAVQRDQGRCEPVKGYSSYISLLPGGKDKQESNFSLIEQAKQEVKSLEIKNKKRDVKFEKPTDIYYLNTKYTMVSFEVYFRPIENSRFSTRPAIFGLLFEGTGSDGLTGYTSKYVKWIGKNDLADYKAASIKAFCGYFRREGVADCLPDTAGEKNASGIKKGTNREGRISGDQVTSGRIRAEFIDPSIARKKDVEKAVESSLGRMDQLRSDVKEQRESLTSLSQVLQTMEMRMKSFPEKEQEFLRKQEERLGAFDQKLKKIEENLTRQVEASKDLESKVDTLTALLEGVTRNRNTIVINGANLQIVNGTGATLGEVNGTGNLIIGYNEKKPGESLLLGSHDIIYPRPETESSVSSGDFGVSRTPSEEKGFFSGKCFIGTAFD